MITKRIALLKPEPLNGRDVPVPNDMLVAGMTINKTNTISDQTTGKEFFLKAKNPTVGNNK